MVKLVAGSSVQLDDPDQEAVSKDVDGAPAFVSEVATDNQAVVAHQPDTAEEPRRDSAVSLSPLRSLGAQNYPVAINVRDLWLSYPVHAGKRGSLKAALMGLLGHREAAPPIEFVDALRGVSFSIGQGERVGIIGRNGSGKSTLLRMLAGAYPPSRGVIEVDGEIGTLLDIALGFEVEATGRENIYNRGLALGYSPKQIRAVENQIVEFADLGSFIDLPMRTYSTGMYVRLGFAVSTQFVPDVLLVDEVFSAGDGIFARRAMERMNQIVSGAGIVVLVSHDHASMRQICDRVIWMHRGEIRMDGPTAKVIDAYNAFADNEVAG